MGYLRARSLRAGRTFCAGARSAAVATVLGIVLLGGCAQPAGDHDPAIRTSESSAEPVSQSEVHAFRKAVPKFIPRIQQWRLNYGELLSRICSNRNQDSFSVLKRDVTLMIYRGTGRRDPRAAVDLIALAVSVACPERHKIVSMPAGKARAPVL